MHRVGRTRLQISRNSGSSPDKCPFVCGSARAPLLGRMSNDMPILLTGHHLTLADRFALLWCTLPSVTAAVIHVVPWCTGGCPRSIVDISWPREGSLPCKNACRPTRQPSRAEIMRRAMQRTESGGSEELGNRFWMEPLRMSRECSRPDWTCPHWRLILILEDHSTDGQHSRSVRCRLSKIPRAHEGLFVFRPTVFTPTMWRSAWNRESLYWRNKRSVEPSLSTYVEHCSISGMPALFVQQAMC